MSVKAKLIEVCVEVDDETLSEVIDFLKDHPEYGFRDEWHFIDFALHSRLFEVICTL